ncbi:hypothetical protein SH449x_005200 [Pirellulaceae bacterium SH449]
MHVSRTIPSLLLLLLCVSQFAIAQQPPYDVFPTAEPPYYRVRYDAGTENGDLIYPVHYTIWIPPDVAQLRGVIVHQHGCGEGSCKSGLTGAFDFHWQALALKHACALLSPAYEQPDQADCQRWCDPRHGSSERFLQCLKDLGMLTGHPELSHVPWALWGHSGGGHWAGGMVMMHPERVVAAWLRSGVPLLEAESNRSDIKAHQLPAAALKVPLMCNLGTKEGVTDKEGRFAGVWPANQKFFESVRSAGGLIAIAIDPLTSHECGNQRYLAIPWLDHCLTVRLPAEQTQLPAEQFQPLHDMPRNESWLAAPTSTIAVSAAEFEGDAQQAVWLPNSTIAKKWIEYVTDTAVTDTTPPPAPTRVELSGNELTWQIVADLESGLASFIIERDGQFLAKVPDESKNPFGRPVFQNLQYSDTPTQPLVPLRYVDTTAVTNQPYRYTIRAVNTVGLESEPADAVRIAPAAGNDPAAISPPRK